jgi:uncharacterized protein YndB with AHSA1/START domain
MSTTTSTYTTPTDTQIVMRRDVRAPRELVFDAHTKAEHLRQWMLGPDGWEMTVCEVDLRVGGAWRYAWRNADGRDMEMTGEYVAVEAPERVVFTERWGDEWPEATSELLLTEEAGTTTITMTMTYASKEVRDAALAVGMTDGMDVSYDRLDALLAA